MTEPKPLLSNAHKRVVLVHTTGPLTGLSQILGTVPPEGAYPPVLAPIDLGDGQVGQAHHRRTTARSVVYQEFVDMSLGKLGDFHPEQR